MSADSEFVFDAVVGFLTSPIWNVPVLTFIEQNCLVFDADAQKRDTYEEIHEQYKSMVETLLSSVLKDFGIAEEQFIQACSRGGNNPQFNAVQREVFEQMWAAEDFEVFKRLMLQKNIELQLQALHLIQQRNNVIPPSLTMGGPFPAVPPKGSSKSTPGDEDAIMQEVLKKSKEEYEMQQKSLKVSEMELEKSLAYSEDESARLMEEAKREGEKLEKALNMSIEAQKNAASEAEKIRDEVRKESAKPAAEPVSASSTKAEHEGHAKDTSKQASLPALKPTKAAQKTEMSTAVKQGKSQASRSNTAQPNTAARQAKSEASRSNAAQPSTAARQAKSQAASDAASNWFSSAKAEASATSSQSSAATDQNVQMTEVELARRTEYLKQQRDKLLELKKQERQKRLTTYTEQQPKARPTSARAARRVTDGEQAESSASEPSQGDKEKKLAVRRALAECLKREVVDKR